ncbi:hypothetical protein EmuJ_000942700 [Echinococcus multilocularis]|uniref:Uncharacterized protein n=1 Tax=Echinococcus multilocularis TaxID=6211 RepID=A0A068YHP9_ECHMU|nr:hypothetical protein EmuJ_000942700 [Echinococcus multilocularis]
MCNTTIPTTCPTAVSTGVLDTAQSATHYQQNIKRMMQTNVMVNSIDIATHLVDNGQVVRSARVCNDRITNQICRSVIRIALLSRWCFESTLLIFNFLCTGYTKLTISRISD